MLDLIENIKNYNHYKDKLVLGKYLIQTSFKRELMDENIKIKNYIMTKKIENKFLDFRPSYFNKFRAKKNILVEFINELFGDYLIESDFYSIKNDYDIIINDFSINVLIKEVIRDLVIIEYNNKQVLVYLGKKEMLSYEEVGDYIIKEENKFVIFNIRILSIYSMAELQAYFGLQFRQTNTLRILDIVIRLFNRHQKVKDYLETDEEKISQLFTKNNISKLQQFDFKNYLYFNETYKIKWDDLLNIASVGATGCLTADTLIEVPRDLIKNPKGIRIDEIYKNKEKFKHIYSYNIKDKKIELDEIKDIWISGKKQVYLLELENGFKIKASGEHKFLVCSNFKNSIPTKFNYKTLDKLKKGDYILIFNRSEIKDYKNGEYIKVNYFSNIRKQLEHRFIMKELNFDMSNKNVVHHINENKFDNSIDNLKVMNIKEHSSFHTKKRGLYGKDIWRNGEHPKGFLNKTHKIKKINFFEKLGFDYYKLVNKYNQTNKPMNYKISKEQLSEIRKKYRVNYYSKVKSITHIGEKLTYDIEVKKNHNYIANNMVVHNSGKTFTLNLILLQLLFSKNFKRIIYFDTQNTFEETINSNINSLYVNRTKYLQDSYFKVDENNFYLSEIDFVMAVNYLLETRGYATEGQKAMVLKTEYFSYDEFIEDINNLLDIEKKRLGYKNLSKLDDLEAVSRFVNQIKVKETSIFDDLETKEQFFVILSFKNPLFYSVSSYIYLQKLKDLLFSRDDKKTYLITDETQKYLGATFLKNTLLDLVKEKRQFGFRFYFTGLSYQDIAEFVKFAHTIIFNSFNDVYMLNNLKSMVNTPIDNLKTPFDKLVYDTINNKAEKTELRLNLVNKSKNIKKLLEDTNINEIDKQKLEKKLKNIEKEKKD